MDLLDRLLEHDRWATTQLLEMSRDLTDAQLDQEFDIGHRTLRETFDHLIFNIAFWTSSMTEQPTEPARSTQRYDRSMPALIDHHERASMTFATLARRLHGERRLNETFVDHFEGHPTYAGATRVQADVDCSMVGPVASVTWEQPRLGLGQLAPPVVVAAVDLQIAIGEERHERPSLGRNSLPDCVW